MRLRADILRPAELTERDRAGWAALRASHPAFASPLLSADFAAAVGRVREDAAVALFRSGDELVGVLPHHRRPGGCGRPIGAPFSDYHALITRADPGFSGQDAVRAAGLATFRYTGVLDPHGVFGPPEGQDDAFAIVLGGPAEAYLEGRRAASAKRFKNWRRLEHKLERELGPVRLEASREPDVFTRLLDWKREQLARTGRHDFLAAVWVTRLLRNLFHSEASGATGLMLGLWAGDRLVAGHFGIREGGVFHPWIAAMDPELTPYSPGQAFLAQAIAAMPALGLTTYDLGPGHDHYKEPFSSRRTTVGRGAVGAVAPAARWAAAAAERLASRERVESARRRLDHIAQVELSLGGRVRAVASAVAAKAGRGGEAGA